MLRDELISLFRKACTVSTFLATKEVTCSAHRIGLDFIVLATFKYLLPDEITFEYEDTPSDTVYGSVPDQILVFKFNEKRSKKKKSNPSETVKLINERVLRFQRAIDQFIARGRSLDELRRFAQPYMPSADPFEDESHNDNDANQTSREDLVGNDLFEEVCGVLSNVVTCFTEPGKEAVYGNVPESLKDYIDKDNLWKHQSLGLSHLLNRSDNHLVISTPTASGKSLIFHTIVKYFLDKVDDSTALFIYPTKALAQDQLRAFGYANAYTFDGDTEFNKRNYIKDHARILFINPDILHATILPNWQQYIRLLSNLRCVVMDEMHYYGGIFGSNVALILRRLRRICSQLGVSDCQFIGCSATVNDPVNLMSTLTGLNKESILALDNETDGSPSGLKKFVFANTRFLSPEDPSSGRVHPLTEAAPLLVRMVKHNMKVIAFCKYRRDCELLLRKIYDLDADLKSVVRGYRGGYNPQERREIESLMFSDQLQGIVATSALEVGIDIGSLDAAIIVGFPHTVSSFRQQVGRVGRRQKDSLVVYIASGTVVDQNYLNDPKKVLMDPVSQSPIIFHESLVRNHLQAAAYEQALSTTDGDFDFFPHIEHLEAADLVQLDNGWLSFPFKPSINIRKADDENDDTLVVDSSTNKVLEKIEYDRVSFTLYEGAIFIHQGKAYLVTYLEPDLKFAKVQRTHVKWITRQRDYTDIDPLACQTNKHISFNSSNDVSDDGSDGTHVAVGRGTIKITTKVFGYFKFDENNVIIDAVDVNIPPLILYKTGTWINLPVPVLETLTTRMHHVSGAIHAAEHVIMSIMPLFSSMSLDDVGTECKAPEKEVMATRQTTRIRPARLIFYEKYGGTLGNGILHSIYNKIDNVLKRASETLDACPCELGCGSCIGSGQCVEQNIVLSKNGARVILRLLIGSTVDDIPEGPDKNMPDQVVETVVAVGTSFGDPATQKITSSQDEIKEEAKTEL